MDSTNKFGFPIKAYKIQEEFCKEAWKLYDIDGGIGIFESPTGTGKTLSILCSSLSWINNELNNSVLISKNHETPSWVLNAINKNKKDSLDTEIQKRKNFFNSIKNELPNSSKTLHELFCEVSNDSLEYNINQYRIIISSRTHSQLTQYIDEIKKINNYDGLKKILYDKISVVPLASRTHLCIHDKVSHYPAHLIRDNCHQYTNKNNFSEKCIFKENSTLLARKCLINPMSIEELRSTGSKINACPYYATKEASKYSDIILLPYNIIFNKVARDSFEIKLDSRNTICIVDEAHNLINALESTNRVCITLESLQILSKSCEKLLSCNFLKSQHKSLSIFKQLIRLINSIYNGTKSLIVNKRLRNKESSIQENIIVLDPIEFIGINNMDSFNIPKISSFITEGDLCNKIKETIIKFGRETPLYDATNQDLFEYSDSLYIFKEFLNTFVTSDKKFDKIIIEFFKDRDYKKTMITIIPINIQSKFNDVYLSTKTTMLVGGTLEPISEFQPLFNSVNPKKIIKFSAEHQLSKDNLLCLILTRSVNNDIIDLRYDFRTEEKQLRNLCEILYMLSCEIPDGICVFFTSYVFLEIFYRYLHTSKEDNNYYELITKKKKIFREKRKNPENSKVLLKLYKDHILEKKNTSGGMLLAVLNGSLSEGVNFSDELCRGLVIVSLPFPQKTKILASKEEYFKFSDNQSINNEESYRKIICMKTVNQCIGRAIRHNGDYAAVLLIDYRYQNHQIKRMLPRWLLEHIVDDYGKPEWSFESDVITHIRKFFENKKTGT